MHGGNTRCLSSLMQSLPPLTVIFTDSPSPLGGLVPGADY